MSKRSPSPSPSASTPDNKPDLKRSKLVDPPDRDLTEDEKERLKERLSEDGDCVLFFNTLCIICGISPAHAINAVYQLADKSSPASCEELMTRSVDSLRSLFEHEVLVNLKSQKKTSPSMDFDVSPFVLKAWNMEFKGSIDKRILATIDENYIPNSRYGNSTTIVQSSGYGKSRSVDEMAKTVFTIPMNLRDPSESLYRWQSAYPLPDYMLYKFFVTNLKVRNKEDASRFFALLGKEVRTTFIRMVRVKNKIPADTAFQLQDADAPSEGAKPCQIISGSHSQIAAQWREHLNRARREELYQNVIDRFNAQENPPLLETFRRLASLLPRRKALTAEESSSKTSFPILIYIDEAHTLVPEKKMQMTLYEMLNSVIADLSESVFALFISTHSRINHPMPDQMASSSRIHSAPNLIAPITEAASDLLPTWGGKLPINSKELTLNKLETLEFLSQFGRPLWYNTYMSKEGSWVLEVAAAKLIWRDIQLATDLSDSEKLALLDSLVGHPRQIESKEEHLDMIAHHMRTVFCFSQDRNRLVSGYPSEPILTMSALHLVREMERSHEMKRSHPKYNVDVLAHILSQSLSQFSASVAGQREEQVAMIILLRAYAAAVEEDHSVDSGERYGKAVSLTAFLRHLLQEDSYDMVVEIEPENCVRGRNPKLSDAFDHYYIRFNHFIGAADTGMTHWQDAAFVYFLRCAAVVGSEDNPAFEIMIPAIYSKDPDTPLDKSQTTSILISVPRRGFVGRTTQSINEDDIPFFPSDDRVPYISLVMDLVARQFSKGAERPSERQLNRVSHPCYAIFVRGCSRYRNIDHQKYKALLEDGTLLSGNPRPHALAGLSAMKPSWGAGTGSFAFMKDSTWLNTDLEEVEEVTYNEPLEAD